MSDIEAEVEAATRRVQVRRARLLAVTPVRR